MALVRRSEDASAQLSSQEPRQWSQILLGRDGLSHYGAGHVSQMHDHDTFHLLATIMG